MKVSHQKIMDEGLITVSMGITTILLILASPILILIWMVGYLKIRFFKKTPI